VNEAEILEVLEAKGALLRGHFRLSSGRHSDTFVQKFRVLEDPRLTQRFGAAIAAAFEGKFDVVASPAIGAIVLGFATALATGARAIFAERANGALKFRRGFGLLPGERVLVVEDVVTTGGSAAEVVELATAAGGRVIGVGVLIDRGDPSRPADLGAPLTALLSLQVSSWTAEACPLCLAGEMVADPGSRRR
jgi:orotate phosphoribosyltransferase